jgi:hypothetical protein
MGRKVAGREETITVARIHVHIASTLHMRIQTTIKTDQRPQRRRISVVTNRQIGYRTHQYSEGQAEDKQKQGPGATNDRVAQSIRFRPRQRQLVTVKE